MGSRDQDRSARTNSGIFVPGWFNSRAGRGQGAKQNREGETPMLRKMILIIAAIATISGAVALSSSEASARWGGRGWGGGHAAFGSVGRVGGWGWRGAGWRGLGWGGRGAGWGWRGVGWGWRGGRFGGWGWRGPGWGWRRAGWGSG